MNLKEILSDPKEKGKFIVCVVLIAAILILGGWLIISVAEARSALKPKDEINPSPLPTAASFEIDEDTPTFSPLPTVDTSGAIEE